MNLQGVHLVIRHHLDQRAQIRHRDKLSAAIHHEASQPIGRRILDRTLWQHETCRTLLLWKLQHGAGSPYQSFYRRSRDGGYVADGEAIAFLAEQSGWFLIRLEHQHDVAGRGLSRLRRERFSHQVMVIGSKEFRHLLGVLSALHHVFARWGKHSLCPAPLLEFRDYKRFFVDRCPATRKHQGAASRQQETLEII